MRLAFFRSLLTEPALFITFNASSSFYAGSDCRQPMARCRLPPTFAAARRDRFSGLGAEEHDLSERDQLPTPARSLNLVYTAESLIKIGRSFRRMITLTAQGCQHEFLGTGGRDVIDVIA